MLSKKHNRLFRLTMALWVAACLVAAGVPALAQDEPRVLVFSTGPVVTQDFAMGRSMATLWSLSLSQENNLQCLAVPSAGSEDNLSLLKLGKADLVVVESLVARTAYAGQVLYDGAPFVAMRSLFQLWPNVENFVTTQSRKVTGTVVDLKGLNVSAGSPGNGEYSTLMLLGALGINRSDMQMHYLDPFKACQAMVKRSVDAASLNDGPNSYPVRCILEDSEIKPVYLQFTPEQVATINANSLYQGRLMEIPANSYPGQDKPLFTLAQDNYLICKADLDKKTVYLLTKVFFEKYGEWGTATPLRQTLLDVKKATVGLQVPLHEGAYQYFKEKGVEIPPHLVPPELRQSAPAATSTPQAQTPPQG